MQLGKKIKKIRELKNFTQEHVASEIGITQGAYSKIENGDTDLTINKLEQIATVLEMLPEDILTFNDKQIIFNVSHNQNATGVLIKNQISKNEKKSFEDHIQSLKEENSYLKSTINKLINKHGNK
jgi:transcriptional regulator with XRE-family HTH domain